MKLYNSNQKKIFLKKWFSFRCHYTTLTSLFLGQKLYQKEEDSNNTHKSKKLYIILYFHHKYKYQTRMYRYIPQILCHLFKAGGRGAAFVCVPTIVESANQRFWLRALKVECRELSSPQNRQGAYKQVAPINCLEKNR